MVYILLGTGFEETEAIAPLDLLRRAGIDVLTVGVDGKTVTGGHGIAVNADITLGEMDLTQMDMIVLPGGLGGVNTVRNSPEALNALQFGWENGKYVAAICAGPTVLSALGITAGKNVTCYPGCEADMPHATVHADVPVVQDGKLITGASAGCAVAFGLALIRALKGNDASDAVARQIVIR